jgi:hypothetical protein
MKVITYKNYAFANKIKLNELFKGIYFNIGAEGIKLKFETTIYKPDVKAIKYGFMISKKIKVLKDESR